MIFYDWGKKLIGYEYYDISFLKPNKDCDCCDVYNDYVCSYCEIQEISEGHFDDALKWLKEKGLIQKSSAHYTYIELGQRFWDYSRFFYLCILW